MVLHDVIGGRGLCLLLWCDINFLFRNTKWLVDLCSKVKTHILNLCKDSFEYICTLINQRISMYRNGLYYFKCQIAKWPRINIHDFHPLNILNHNCTSMFVSHIQQSSLSLIQATIWYLVWRQMKTLIFYVLGIAWETLVWGMQYRIWPNVW